MSSKISFWVLISIVVLSIVALATVLSSMFLPKAIDRTRPITVTLDPDSTRASFAKDNQADVYIIAENNSDTEVKVSSFEILLQIEPSKLEVNFIKDYVPVTDWFWFPNVGVKDTYVRVSGGGSTLTFKPKEPVKIALLRLTPKSSSTIRIVKDGSVITAVGDGRNVFDKIKTPDSQPFNIR